MSLASESNNLKVVKTICDSKGVDLDSQNKDRKTALHVAALKSRIEVVKFLVKKGAKVDIRENRKRTAFLDAARLVYGNHEDPEGERCGC